MNLSIISSSDMIISAMIFSDPSRSPWLLSCVYHPPYKQKQLSFWESIDMIGSAHNGPWLCVGDFNDVSAQVDKKGGKHLAQSSSGGL